MPPTSQFENVLAQGKGQSAGQQGANQTMEDPQQVANQTMEKAIQSANETREDVAQVGRLIAKYNDEDFDKFISEEVSKIIFSISESSSTILTPPPISDELKQQIHKLLEGEKEEKNSEKLLRKLNLISL